MRAKKSGALRAMAERQRVTQTTLRNLARRPLTERHRVLREAQSAVDPEETHAWDMTLIDLVL